MSHPLPTLVRRLAEEALSLAQVLEQAQEAQWSRSLTPQPREDTSERSRGTISDPTGDTAADTRRLALRAQVIAGEALLESATRAMTVVRRRLSDALARWNGE